MRGLGSVRVAILTALASVLLSTGVANAIRLAHPALFAVDTVATFTGRIVPTIAFPTDATTYPAFLYAFTRLGSPGTGRVYSVAEDGSVSELGSSTHDDYWFAFGPPSFSNRLFGIDPSWPTSKPDGVYQIAPDGIPLLVSSLGGGNPNARALAFPPPGPFGEYLYVASLDADAGGTEFDYAIARIDPTGAFAGRLLTDSNGPYEIAFSPGGGFGEYLYHGTWSNARILRTSPAGTSSPFVTLPFVAPQAMVFSSGGPFGESLLVGFSGAGARIYQVTASGDTATFADQVHVFDMAFAPATGDLYVATGAEGTILRIAPIPATSIPGTPLDGLSGIGSCVVSPCPVNDAQALSLTLVAKGDAHVTLFDPNGRLIATLQETTAVPRGGARRFVLREQGVHLAAGVYFLRVDARAEHRVSKVVVLH